MAFSLAANVHAARAQLTASATVETQYDVRGATLDYGRPDGRLSLSYDLADGFYTGVSGLMGDTPEDGVQPLGYTAYLGYAWRGNGGLNWDVGLDDLDVTLHPPAVPRSILSVSTPAHPRVSYTEAYGGFSSRDLSVRLFLSPNYLRDDARTAYLDVDQGFRLTSRLRVYAHGGALTPLLGSSRVAATDRERFDAGAYFILMFSQTEFRLGWTGIAPHAEVSNMNHERRSNLSFSATKFF